MNRTICNSDKIIEVCNNIIGDIPKYLDPDQIKIIDIFRFLFVVEN